MLVIDYVILLLHSLGLPYNYVVSMMRRNLTVTLRKHAYVKYCNFLRLNFFFQIKNCNIYFSYLCSKT